ncbi:MAG: metallophosphoesterase [Desulfomonile tiedjei]|nr:metallophosphoesterase [Desulfomonile tiedjei]
MKRFAIFVPVFLLLISPALCGADDEIFRFAVFSDTRGQAKTAKCSDDNFGVSQVLEPIVNAVLATNRSLPIKLVLFPGDMMSGGWKRDAASVAECNKIQLLHWRETVKPLLDAGIGFSVTAGNHEVIARDESVPRKQCSEHASAYTPAEENFKVFREVLGDMLPGRGGPESDFGLTYSFDMNGCHFVVLTAYTMSQKNSFSEETLEWLARDLSEAKARGLITFVASHPPAFPGGGHMWDSLPFFDPEYTCDNLRGIDRRKDRDRFWDLLKKNNVAAYFCGHEHQIQVQEVEGVWHVVSAGLTTRLYPLNGSPWDKQRNTILYDGKFQNPRASIIWPWNETQKAYWGWCLVTVAGKKVTMEVFGSDVPPTKESDLKLLKSFTLTEGGS